MASITIRNLDDRHHVVRWIATQPESGFYVASATQAEILHSHRIRRPHPRVRQRGARPYASIAAERRRAGRPISQFDAQIAAIAHSARATIATRNVDDFEGHGVNVVNPWHR